jgi:hypothetical protein
LGCAGSGPNTGSPAPIRPTSGKKPARPSDPAGPCPPHLGPPRCRCSLVEPPGSARPAPLGHVRGGHPAAGTRVGYGYGRAEGLGV